MRNLSLLATLLGLLALTSTVRAGELYALQQSGGAFVVQQLNSTAELNEHTVAHAVYNRTLNTTGWDYLYIAPQPAFFAKGVAHVSRLQGYRAAGYLEGYLTAQSLWDNYVVNVRPFATAEKNIPAKRFIEKHMLYMSSNLVNNPEDSLDAPPGFVDQLEKIWSQLEGLLDGYNQRVVDNQNPLTDDLLPQTLTKYEMFLMSYQPEIGDVQTYLQATNASFDGLEAMPKRHLREGQHCSALIKPTADDLFVSHDTWSNLNSMIRQYKTYVFETTVSMSSYPGMLNSMDDWYITSNKLAVQETTNGLYNNTLYKDYFTADKVSEWIRVMIANYIAVDGKQWTDYFRYQNSGSYNNQWMAVDMKVYTPGTTIADGLLHICETLPGFAECADVSHVIREQGYWASYNIPYFKSIFDLSGNALMEQQYGSYFSYTKYARPLIFARNHSDVHDLESMKALMRYNNFEHDRLSEIPNCTGTVGGKCHPSHSAMLSIASRGDLDPVGNVSTMGPLAAWAIQGVGLQNLGAIDTKIASYKNFQNKFAGVVISGPTSYQQPVFSFSKAPAPIRDLPRNGIPDTFDFDWQTYDLPQFSFPVPSATTARVVLGTDGSLQVEALADSFSNDTLATIELNRTLFITGWDHVTVRANPAVLAKNATLAYYGAGYVEGFATAESIWNLYYDFELPEFATAPKHAKARSAIREQIAYMRNVSAEATPALADMPSTSYQKQLRSIFAQLDGLAAGYSAFVSANAGSTDAEPLTTDEIYMLSFQAEMWDIETYVSVNFPADFQQYSRRSQVRNAHKNSHCSALIKPTADDLFVAHDTWTNYNSMIRQYKTYVFETTMAMSSYAGMLTSSDDWYITSNNMAITETTNIVTNVTLYKAFSTQTVCAWARTMVAVYLATSAEEFQDLFVFLNSGSYNNQWMAVDMNLYTEGTAAEDLPDGLLWISETLPGIAKKADVTSVIREQGYWASYNIPYFKTIFQLSGTAQQEEEYGAINSYTKYARPLIFHRNQSQIADLEGMKLMMRYNDFEHDPLSKIGNCTGTIYNNTCKPSHSAMLTIASRGDLDPVANVSTMGPWAAFDGVGQQNLGAIDSKIASFKRMKSLTGVVISGPTSVQQKVFDYTTAPSAIANVPRKGIPERWDFPWMTYQGPSGHNAEPVAAGKSRAIVAVIIGIIGAVLAVAIAAVVVWQNKLKNASKESAPLVDQV